MQHFTFKVSASIVAITCILTIVSFDYFNISEKYDSFKLLFKLCPLTLMLFLPFIYIIKYKMTIYSFFISIALFLCLLGDIFLGLYDPNLDQFAENNRMIYLSFGGASFLLARLLFLTIFMFYPYDRFKLIRYSYKKLIISHILFNIPFIAIGILFLVNNRYTILSFMTLIYFVLGFGFQMSYAFLRIGRIEDESITSNICGFIGITLFNLADVLLMLAMLTSYLPFYWTFVSDNIYWISMFLLTISVVRYSDENFEREINY